MPKIELIQGECLEEMAKIPDGSIDLILCDLPYGTTACKWDVTLEGETVLDNTMGSGSTGVACLNTGRNFIGIEKDPAYFKIAEKRINENL